MSTRDFDMVGSPSSSPVPPQQSGVVAKYSAGAMKTTITSTSSYEAQCTCCSFRSDYDSVFRHGLETHSIYICVCCSTHYNLAKELMVHLYREHRVPPQRYRSEFDFIRAGGSETVLCCVECSSIFEVGSQDQDVEGRSQNGDEELRLASRVFDGHECFGGVRPISLLKLSQHDQIKDEPMEEEDEDVEDEGEDIKLDPLLLENDPDKRLLMLIDELADKLGADLPDGPDSVGYSGEEEDDDTVYTVTVNLPLDEDAVLTEMLKKSGDNCKYCRQVQLIRIDKRQLAIHLFSKHCWTIQSSVQQVKIEVDDDEDKEANSDNNKSLDVKMEPVDKKEEDTIKNEEVDDKGEDTMKKEDIPVPSDNNNGDNNSSLESTAKEEEPVQNDKTPSEPVVLGDVEETETKEVSPIATPPPQIPTIKMDWKEFKHTVLKKVFLSPSILFTYKDCDMAPFGDVPCECLICGQWVESQQSLFTHWRKIHRGVAMKCAMCQGRFLFAGALYSHLCFGTPNPVIKNEIEPPGNGANNKALIPHGSGGKFPSHNSSLADSPSHGLGGGEFTVLSNEDDSADTIVLRYQCNICENVLLPGFFNYMVHLRKVHNRCELCLEGMKSQKELEHHMKKHKLNHFCWKCGVTYCAKPNFMTHLFWKHGSESKECSICLKKKWPHIYHFCVPPPVFACETCGFYFTKPKCLVVHRRLHTGEKLRSCTSTNCTEKFISKKLLDKHVLAVHSGDNRDLSVLPPTPPVEEPLSLPHKEEASESPNCSPRSPDDKKDSSPLPSTSSPPPPAQEPQPKEASPLCNGYGSSSPHELETTQEEQNSSCDASPIKNSPMKVEELDKEQDSQKIEDSQTNEEYQKDEHLQKEEDPIKVDDSLKDEHLHKEEDSQKEEVHSDKEEKQQVINILAHDLDLSDESSDEEDADTSNTSNEGREEEKVTESGSAMTNILDHCENLEKNLNQSAMDIDDSCLNKSLTGEPLKKVATLALDLNVEMDLMEGGEKMKSDFRSMSPLLTPLDDFIFSVPDIPTFEDNSLPEHIIRENAIFSLQNEHDYCLRINLKRNANSPAASPVSKKGESRHKKLKGHKTSSPKKRKRNHSSSSSSSSSSSCGSNCSCSNSSSSSSSSSSGGSSSEDESTLENNKKQMNNKNVVRRLSPLKLPLYHPHSNYGYNNLSSSTASYPNSETGSETPVKRGRGRPRGSVNRNKDGIPTAKKRAIVGGAGKRIGRLIVPKQPRPLNPDGSPMKRKYKKQKGKFSRKSSTAQYGKENDDGGSQNSPFPEDNYILETDLETEESGSEEIYDKKQSSVIGKVPNFDEIWTMSNEQYLLKFVRGVKELEELRPPPPELKLKIKIKKQNHQHQYSLREQSQAVSSFRGLHPFVGQVNPTYSVQQVGQSESRLKVRNPIKPLIFKRNSTSFPVMPPLPITNTATANGSIVETKEEILLKKPFIRLNPIKSPVGGGVHKLPPQIYNKSTGATTNNIPVLGKNRLNTNNNNGNALHMSITGVQHPPTKSYHHQLGENLPKEGTVPLRRGPKIKIGTGRGGRGRGGGRRSVGGIHINILPPKKPVEIDPEITSPAMTEQLYCYCHCPHDNVSQMIGCDSRDCQYQWFHFECVGITIPPKGKWYCPDCDEKRMATKPLKNKYAQDKGETYEYTNNTGNSNASKTTSPGGQNNLFAAL